MMKKQSLLSLTLLFSLLTPLAGQQPTSPPAPPQQGTPAEDEVVRITANLVQVDAVVTDKNGKQVTDLRPEDFQILEDGRAQKITNFSYISTQPALQPEPSISSPDKNKNAPPAPPVRLRPEQVRRTIALVVDDLGLSFESTAYVRRALKKFVHEQMQTGDLAAIIRTSAGMGALQQFTSDKRQLDAAIERVRWYPFGRSGISAFEPITSDPLSRSRAGGGRNPRGASNLPELDTNSEFEDYRNNVFTIGTLGALNFVVQGLRELPGRKSVLLISDGFQIFNISRNGRLESGFPGEGRTRDSQSNGILEALRHLTDLANRASVVIYTMDARGLQTLGFTAADDLSGLSPQQLEDRLSDRRTEFFQSQDGLNYLAGQTGGFFIHDSNDLAGGIRRVLDDQRGYYLIGYRPDDSTFDPVTGRRRFHKITVKIKTPGLRVRSRTGFYGVPDNEAHPLRRTRDEQLLGALNSPFSSGAISLRLTSLFGNEQSTGSFVRSLLHIDLRDLTFTEEPDDWHKAVMDIVAVTFGDNGRVVDQVNRTHTIRLRGETYKQFMQTGLVYMLNVPVKKAGAYQLRIAVRDAASERVGSASQFIEVPNLSRNRLVLSGLVVSGSDLQAARGTPAQQPTGKGAMSPTAPGTPATEKTSDAPDPQAGPAVRRLRRGMALLFNYLIYNAQLDRTTHRPQLQTQVRLFHDGEEVFVGKVMPYDAGNQTDLKRLVAGGGIELGKGMKPGEYILQVIVSDLLAKEKQQVATQWIDFEIVK